MRGLHVPEGYSAELILVDNGSTDGTGAAVKEGWEGSSVRFKYLFEPRGGKSVALNSGLREARGDVILFTDDDVVPPREWIGPMTAPVFEGEADAVAGGIRLGPEFDLPWLTQGQRLWLAHTEGVKPGTPIPLIGANMAIGRSVFEELGGFDEEAGPGATGHAEDILYWLRVRDAGFRIKSLVEIEATHHPGLDRLTWRGYATQARKRGEFAAYVEHHYEGIVRNHHYLGVIRAGAKLWAARARHFVEWMGATMMPTWELNLLESYHMRLHMLVERNRDRRYETKGSGRLDRKGAETAMPEVMRAGAAAR
jgi:glycosyltransferase involved in cell wall biosynthesis